MKVPFFLILALAASALSAQSDPEHPAPLQSNVLEVTTHGEGGNSYEGLQAFLGRNDMDFLCTKPSGMAACEVYRKNGQATPCRKAWK